MDSGLNSLLKWSIENSANTAPQSADKEVSQVREGKGNINADALRALMGGPSDAQLMKDSIAAIQTHDISLENKLIAFDNFEQLIEQIDNANNMQVLGLWTPLLELLENEEAELRRYAAWCMGTAVQNNVKAQETVGSCPFTQVAQANLRNSSLWSAPFPFLSNLELKTLLNQCAGKLSMLSRVRSGIINLGSMPR